MSSRLNGVLAIYNNFVLHHEVKEDGELAPATNLTMDSMRLLLKGIVTTEEAGINLKFKSIIPENVLYFDEFLGDIIYYTKPQFRKLVFKDEELTGSYKLPFLLFVKKRSEPLKVFALKSKPKNLEAVLCRAPFFNVYNGGGVCMGTARINEEQNTFDDLMKEIDDKFFGSYFTHILHSPFPDFEEFLKENKGNRNVS